MNERLREALRRKIAAHNRLVNASILASVVGTALMWVALYFMAHWFAALGATVVKGVEATMPQRIDRFFAIGVAVELAAGWLAERVGFHRRLREEKSIGFTLIELCLLPARATFGTLRNLRNHIRLDGSELISATDLLVRIVRAGKLAATAVPVEIPSDASRERVLHALQLLDLIYLRQTQSEDCFAVADPQKIVAFL